MCASTAFPNRKRSLSSSPGRRLALSHCSLWGTTRRAPAGACASCLRGNRVGTDQARGGLKEGTWGHWCSPPQGQARIRQRAGLRTRKRGGTSPDTHVWEGDPGGRQMAMQGSHRNELTPCTTTHVPASLWLQHAVAGDPSLWTQTQWWKRKQGTWATASQERRGGRWATGELRRDTCSVCATWQLVPATTAMKPEEGKSKVSRNHPLPTEIP